MCRIYYIWNCRGARAAGSDDQTDPIEHLADELLIDRSFPRRHRRAAPRQGTGHPLRPTGHREGLHREEGRRGARTGPASPQRRPVPPVDVVRVEGYRPETVDGAITCALTDGPFRTLADRAKSAPGVRHVVLIDEITVGTCRGSSGSCSSSSSTGASRSARSTGPTRRSSCHPISGSSSP